LGREGDQWQVISGRQVAADSDEDENKRSDERWKAASVGRESRRKIGRERDGKTRQGDGWWVVNGRSQS